MKSQHKNFFDFLYFVLVRSIFATKYNRFYVFLLPAHSHMNDPENCK